jgi:hypothetical protein
MRSLLMFSLVVAASALFLTAGCTSGREPSDSAADPALSDQLHEDEHDHLHGTETGTETDPPPDDEAAAVAERFAAAFADTASGDAAAWLAALRPDCYSTYCDLLDGIDLTEIPAAAPTGSAAVAPGDDPSVRTAAVPAGTGTWRLLLFAAEDRWLVTDCRWEPA